MTEKRGSWRRARARRRASVIKRTLHRVLQRGKGGLRLRKAAHACHDGFLVLHAGL